MPKKSTAKNKTTKNSKKNMNLWFTLGVVALAAIIIVLIVISKSPKFIKDKPEDRS